MDRSVRSILSLASVTRIENLYKAVRYFAALSKPQLTGSELQWRQATGKPFTAGRWVWVKKEKKSANMILSEIKLVLGAA